MAEQAHGGDHAAALPVERWFAAIAERRSRRTFDGRPLADGTIDALLTHLAAFIPFEDARAVLIREAPPEIFLATKEDRGGMPAVAGAATGIIGAYGKITGVADVLAFAGRSAGADGFAVEEQIGYVGEAALLEATALGLDTCWVGGFFSPSLSQRLIGAEGGERVFAVSPVGHGAAELSRKERLLYRMGKPKKRRNLEHIALGLATKDWPGWAIAGLRAAQVAPSAVNRQPWRFRLEAGTVLLACDAPDNGQISRRLDCGIAMLHFELGVRHFGRGGSWEPPQTGLPLDVARWRPAEGAVEAVRRPGVSGVISG
jgi:nitroreductase